MSVSYLRSHCYGFSRAKKWPLSCVTELGQPPFPSKLGACPTLLWIVPNHSLQPTRTTHLTHGHHEMPPSPSPVQRRGLPARRWPESRRLRCPQVRAPRCSIGRKVSYCAPTKTLRYLTPRKPSVFRRSATLHCLPPRGTTVPRPPPVRFLVGSLRSRCLLSAPTRNRTWIAAFGGPYSIH